MQHNFENLEWHELSFSYRNNFFFRSDKGQIVKAFKQVNLKIGCLLRFFQMHLAYNFLEVTLPENPLLPYAGFHA